MSPEDKKRYVVGRIGHTTIATREGYLVAAEGLLVNKREVDIAEGSGLLDDLYQATHRSPDGDRPFDAYWQD